MKRRSALQWSAMAVASSLSLPLFVCHAKAAALEHFALGVASGSPTADSVVLWTRLLADEAAPLPASVDVDFELAEDEGFSRIAARGRAAALADEAHTVHVQPGGLEPARWYWYRFTALGQRSPVGRTRTAPRPEDDTAGLEFAIASCQRWEHGHWAAWRDVAAPAEGTGRSLDLVLFLGDYIYEYAAMPGGVRTHTQGAATTLAGYRDRYALYRSDPLLRAAHAACPWLVIWDDHEVENDYAATQGQHLQPDFAARRAAAYRAWWEHMPLPRALRPRPDGATAIHGRLDWGRLARLQWLDARQHRDPQPCPRPGAGGSNTVRLADCPALPEEARSLLGPAQERWLAEGWSVAHPWNLLAQTTLMARFSTESVATPGPAPGAAVSAAASSPGVVPDATQGRYWTDGWDGYPAARQRLLAVLAERRVPGAVVLSGDVHANYVAELAVNPDGAASPRVATEFCGTSISSRGWPQHRVQAALAHNPHIRHGRADERGYVRFSLTRERLEADLRTVADVRDADSAVRSQARFVVEAGRVGALPR